MSTIVCLGDSITAGYPYAKDKSWVYLCCNRLNLNLINAGVSNDTVGDMLARYQIDVQPHHPDVVIILAGTNDAWQELPLETTINNYKILLEMINADQAIPVLGLPVPIIKEKVKSYYQQEHVENFNQQLNKIRDWIKKFAHVNALEVLDFYTSLCQQGTDQGKIDLYCDDGGHPNIKGYGTMAKSIENDLLELAKKLQVL